MSNVVNMKDAKSLRDKVFEFEEIMRQMPPADCRVTHHFSKGIYARELFIPAGTVLTGKIHKTENLNIMSQGELSVLTESGVVRVKAPFTIVSPPGTKRIAFAHEDTVWTTIHATTDTDLVKIEHQFVAQDEPEYLAHCAALRLGAP